MEVRDFLARELPPEIALDVRRWSNPAIAKACTWQRKLAAKGWGAPHWPVEHGGMGWSPIRKHIYMEELYRADAPDFLWASLHMLGPVIIAFGSPEHKARFLPPMLSGEVVWCQGFSEPSAGSDLANLRTTAVLEGDYWRINGQKIWTSDAQEAQWGFFLVRTDATVKPQRGLSFIVVKLDTKGLTVRPIRTLDGREELNEIFLDNVIVPRDQLIGEAGQGWTYAKYLLEKERTASAFLYFNKRALDRAKALAREMRVAGGGRLLDTAEFSRKVAQVEADLLALEWSVLRILAQDKYAFDMSAVVSALKIRGSEMQQRVTDLALEALGPQSLRYLERGDAGIERALGGGLWQPLAIGAMAQFLYTRAATIYGGAREVQKNIIAKTAFSL
jgi:alkylation response protein AidB-like acyl-CoA dehydrogenase